MNKVNIVFQSKHDAQNLLDTKEKAQKMSEGLTVVFIEKGTAQGQIGVELIIRGDDVFGRETILGASITENNFDGVMGAFIGARMRWNRMPMGQFELVNHYMVEVFENFLSKIPSNRTFSKEDIQSHVKRFTEKLCEK